jgi:hypothetical protein
MMDIPIQGQIAIRCRKCFNLLAENSVRCEDCGNGAEADKPTTLIGKIKRLLGIEISSEIVTINLEDTGRFFTNQEIEALLDMENVTVLGLEDVPDRDAMFYKSKRVRKPTRR